MAAMRQTWTDDRMDDLAKSVDTRFEQVDKRFEQVDKRFEQIHGDILVGVLLAASLSGVVTMIVS